ncbi:MAG: hypothetical protein ABI867_21465 [Kofleriaceae bacterium]
MLALRAYARYFLPFTLLSVLTFSPLLVYVFALPAPLDVSQARQLLKLEWLVVAAAWFLQLWLVAAVAPALRRDRVTQVAAFVGGAANLVRMAIPWLVAIAAILIGAVALVIPAFVLIVLLALTGASVAEGMPAPLHDSIAVVRANLRAVIVTVVAIVVVDLAVAGVVYLVVFAPFAKKPTPDQLAAARQIVRVVAVALALISPLAAAVLAAIRVRAR